MEHWERKTRILTQVLIFSGAVNIGLLSTFFYFVLKDKQIVPLEKMEPKVVKKEITKQELFSLYSSMSFRELLTLLINKEHIEDGYLKRDLALGFLTQYHHFDLIKAIGNRAIQKRKISFGKEKDSGSLIIFAGLLDEDYEAVLRYAYTEKWPYTAEGIFSLIQKSTKPRDPTLEQAFFLTSEFQNIQSLFGLEIQNEVLLDLLSEGKWEVITSFFTASKEKELMLEEKRRSFLHKYLDQNSSMAAKLFLQTDFLYVLKKFDDQQILSLLNLLQEKNEPVQQLCLELIKSPRSDVVWKKSAEKLFVFAKEPFPEKYNQEDVVAHFFPKMKGSKKSTPLKDIAWGKEHPNHSLYLVKDGDSLWKIARAHKIEMDEIIRVNDLKNDKIRPGKKILLPKKKTKTH
ncbi:MAG: LysM peptidoglycan-binding domain-containing protein [Chlamydiota bacterium]